MGSFQITYDDFSGGQYMGSKSTNQPKNQWHGTNVIVTPDGNLIPAQCEIAGQYTPPGTTTFTNIYDHWVVETNSYVFINTVGFFPSTTTSRMLKTINVNDGSLFPATMTPTTLTGVLNGKVAYNPNNLTFYYIASTGTIYSITDTGTIASVSAALAGLDLRDIATYNYRQVAWGGVNATAKKRLYYSGTDLTTWSTANYYEFSGKILNVLPRTNDLLVICDTGVFSLVGVLGASITSQLIVPQENVTEGMSAAVVVGRNAYFLDQRLNGAPDGRIYRLTGSSTQTNLTLDIDDVVESQFRGLEQMVIGAVNDGRLVIQTRSGHCYAESTPGTWARLYSPENNFFASDKDKVKIGRAGPNSLNEYFMVASVPEGEVVETITLTRYIHNVAKIEDKTAKFIYTSPAGSGSPYSPQGNAQLSEYWHSKPFTVKEIFVEFFPRNESVFNNPQCSVGITPTGIIDLYTAYNGSSWVEATEPMIVGINNSNKASVTQRFRPNNAPKGFGVKPILNFTDVTIKRVILNCED